MDVTCPGCQHPASQHAGMAGCLAQADTGYCPCTETPDRIRAQVPPNLAPRDLTEGRRLRDEGAAAAGTTSPTAEAWRSAAAEAIQVLADQGEQFTADDLVDRVGLPPVPNMMGSVFLTAKRRDVINLVGYEPSSRPSNHARIQRIWVGA